MNKKLINLGFSERFLQESTFHGGLYLGRVVAQYKDLYNVATEKSEVLSQISGKLRYSSDESSDYPAVGDFVMVDREDEQHGNAIIHKILTRKSLFVRRAAGTSHDVQVVAANIDTIFICMSLNHDFNLRRLERYLSIAWDSGAVPVVILTKSDLCNDLPERLTEIQSVATGVDIVVTSSMTEDGYHAILKYISPGLTVAFIGSSGVGKSTLINRLLGENAMETREIRKDDKGKHTTTRRELIVIPSGGAVIDTPGMREIGAESVNLVKTFADIDEFAERCRFKDCLHENEPGCAVKKAIEEGLITQERLQNYKKLKREAKYEGLNSREIEKEKITEMFTEFGGIKNARDYMKSKNKK
ncbi:ribosome biogenesis GTPase RsgA [Syntrophobotulus glycolicus DSM 8271]|uniref:Small ribosomal subunit biogenesis GTPase RsgA n=1 Tax=Syntrophobotulus glycolicus (strain DSM 8271 / FlGlyR) TaxID=645991 RepID=F0T278_SYNGF|nr:ribosome small subunit-dependent GTPase A [Syntrophobotulus glycolicus]ADY57506.1 ribosome biogenesis GTPase RsgA [Syntrophobotulus glycolicus DSM 8271]